jgi:hypothetical protein
MFIRWQTYRSVAYWHTVPAFIAGRDPPIKRVRAVLVESVRVDGKPRLRHIAFIASYDPDPNPRWANSRRGRFWLTARERLDKLANRITLEQRARIEATLAERVPPLPPDEQAAFDRGVEELMRGL